MEGLRQGTTLSCTFLEGHRQDKIVHFDIFCSLPFYPLVGCRQGTNLTKIFISTGIQQGTMLVGRRQSKVLQNIFSTVIRQGRTQGEKIVERREVQYKHLDNFCRLKFCLLVGRRQEENVDTGKFDTNIFSTDSTGMDVGRN